MIASKKYVNIKDVSHSNFRVALSVACKKYDVTMLEGRVPTTVHALLFLLGAKVCQLYVFRERIFFS